MIGFNHILNMCRGGVRNLGKPVSLCKRYYDEGADEVLLVIIIVIALILL